MKLVLSFFYIYIYTTGRSCLQHTQCEMTGKFRTWGFCFNS